MSSTKGLQSIWVGLGLAVLGGVMALPLAATAQDVTYAEDVAPILEANCVRCHHPGTSAPMSLETYEQVRPWAPMIKLAVQNRMMPPGWYMDRTVGIQDFKNDPSLSDQEIETIARMVHEAGGLMYMDGANLNALMGITRPGDLMKPFGPLVAAPGKFTFSDPLGQH